MLTSEVLNRAADLIEERGWGGMWSDGRHEEGRPLCIEGAIFAAAGVSRAHWLDGGPTCPAYDAVATYLDIPILASDRRLTYHGRLYTWNDSVCRAASEVVEVLRAAAVVEQARESQPSVVSA